MFIIILQIPSCARFRITALYARRSLMVHTTGQSGHPWHRHYDDFIDPWRMIEYHSTRWKRDGLRKESKEKLVLKPL